MKIKRMLACLLALAMLSGATSIPTKYAEAAVKISRSSATVEVGSKLPLSVKGLAKGANVAWKTSNKAVATVTKSKTSQGATIYAKKTGTATITAMVSTDKNGKIMKESYTCKVEVMDAKKPQATPTAKPTATATPKPKPTSTPTPAPSIAPGKLVWSDEFNGSALDGRYWSHQLGNGSSYGLVGWGNNELQSYTSKNATLENGVLKITAKRQVSDNTYTSARIRTDGKVTVRYGRVEARIKLPAVKGLWPAFWLLGSDDVYGRWAASGEIDIMEAKGRLPGQTSGAAHYGGEWPGNVSSFKEYTLPKGQDITRFHVYAIEWDKTSIRWYVDDVKYFELTDWYTVDKTGKTISKPAPFDRPFYILLNMAVGGNFDGGITPPNDFTEAVMEVDYVRVYAK